MRRFTGFCRFWPKATSSGGAERLAGLAARRLSIASTAALAVVALLTLGGHEAIGSMVAMRGADAVTLNLAGRQRMLSQRIVKESLLLNNPVAPTGNRRMLETDLTRFAQAHETLREKNPELGVDAAFGPLDQAFQRFHGAAGLVRDQLAAGQEPDAMPALLEAEPVFLQRMDAAATAWQNRVDGKILRASRLHTLLGLVLPVLLALGAWFTFRPAVRRIRQEILQLAIAQERSELLSLAAEHTRHAVLLGAVDGTVTWVNPAAEPLFSEILTDVPTLADAAPESVADRVRDAVGAGEDLHLDDVSAGGYNFALDLVAVRDEEGRAGRYVMIVTDLSERARRERDRQDVQRLAGRADVSISMLHNVGNTLTSLGLAAAAADEGLRRSRLPGLNRALSLLDEDPEHAASFFKDDPRATTLPRYLHKLSRHLDEEHEELGRDLDTVMAGVEHLRHVIDKEHAGAGSAAATLNAAAERVEAGTLLDEAVRLYGGPALLAGMEVEREPAPADLVFQVDRHTVLHILGNLLTNAFRAIGEDRGLDAPGEDSADARVSMRTGLAEDGLGFIEVADEGVGITPDQLSKIFTSGYSTKPDSQGIGLHASANAATSIGGRLSAHSDGPGTGSTFRLTLPTNGLASTERHRTGVAA